MHQLLPSVFVSLRRETTRKQHFLHEIVTFSSNRFILSNGKVRQHWIVPNIRGIAVPLDVHSPFKSGQVSVPCTDIFGLKMLKLRVYVEPIASLHGGRLL